MTLVQVFDFISSLATAGALLAALWQLRSGVLDARERDEARRVERALELHEDVVAEGATYEGFHRFSVFLRRIGTQTHGLTTWHVVSDADLLTHGCLDPDDPTREQPFADLYTVLWFFERCQLALERRLVDQEVLMVTLGFHFWWWGQLLRDLRGPKASVAIHDLSQQAADWAAADGRLDDWYDRCLTDFAGSTPLPVR